MDTISEWIETTLNLSPDLQVKLFYTALIIFVADAGALRRNQGGGAAYR